MLATVTQLSLRLCCNPFFGPKGYSECFTEPFTYELCCQGNQGVEVRLEVFVPCTTCPGIFDVHIVFRPKLLHILLLKVSGTCIGPLYKVMRQKTMFSDSTGQEKTFLTSVHSKTCKKNVNLKNWKTPNYLLLHELSRDVPSGIFNISQDG